MTQREIAKDHTNYFFSEFEKIMQQLMDTLTEDELKHFNEQFVLVMPSLIPQFHIILNDMIKELKGDNNE